MKTSKRGLASLCLLALCACSACARPPLVKTEFYRATPSAPLLIPTVPPDPPGLDAGNLDLLLYAVDLELALDAANNDKAALQKLFD